MFLNQSSQQNVRKTPKNEFCDDCFAALVTAFGTITVSFFIRIKKYINRKVQDLIRMRNALIENILLENENRN